MFGELAWAASPICTTRRAVEAGVHRLLDGAKYASVAWSSRL